MIEVIIGVTQNVILIGLYGVLCYYAGKKAQREDDIKLKESE